MDDLHSNAVFHPLHQSAARAPPPSGM